MSWDEQGDKEKNKPTLQQNKEMFYKRLFDVESGLMAYLEWLSIHRTILMEH